MKIDKPDWLTVLYKDASGEYDKHLNEWFDDFVEPINKMLSEAVELRSPCPGFTHGITKNKTLRDHYKGLLISIQPIKQETAEDVLRDLIKEYDEHPDLPRHDTYLNVLVDRSKKVLNDI